MDRIRKALKKLTPEERAAILAVLRRIVEGSFFGLDIQKLTGHRNVYRVRKGRVRIIFQKRVDGGYSILAVERRSDTTYGRY